MAGLETLYPHAVFLKVDVDQCQELAASSGIRAMPTIQLYKSAKKVGAKVGASQCTCDERAVEHTVRCSQPPSNILTLVHTLYTTPDQ